MQLLEMNAQFLFIKIRLKPISKSEARTLFVMFMFSENKSIFYFTYLGLKFVMKLESIYLIIMEVECHGFRYMQMM